MTQPNPTGLYKLFKKPMGPGICRRTDRPTPELNAQGEISSEENFGGGSSRPRTPRIFPVIPSHTPPKFNIDPENNGGKGRRSFPIGFW